MCALPSGHVTDALDHLGCRADVLSLDPYTLDEVLETIVAVGARAGVPDRADALVGGLRSRLATVAAAVAGRGPAAGGGGGVGRPAVHRRALGAGPGAAAGGDPVAARPGARSVQTTLGRADRRPRRTSCSSRRAASTSTARRAQAREVAHRFPEPQVWAIDGDGIVVRPGPRLVDGVEAIAAILHPGAVPEPPPHAAARVA